MKDRKGNNMEFRSFFKRFKWGALLPAVIAVIVAILLFSIPTASARTLGIAVGVFLILAGAVRVTAFLLDMTSNPADLLSGVAEISAALWLFITSTTNLAVLALALGIVILLRAAAILLDAFLPRKKGHVPVFSCAVAAILVALAIVAIVDPFTGMRTLMIVTGVAVLFMGLMELCLLFGSGLFRKLPSEYVRGMRELKEDVEE